MSSLGEEAKDWIISIVVAVVLAFLIRQFIVELYIVDGPSMRPTLQSQERLVVNKFIYDFRAPQKGEILVFEYPRDTSRDFIKRVIGLPGETVRIDYDGNIYINGEILNETYGLEKMAYPGIAEQEITLGDDEYFVLGDNRNVSEDSRYPDVGLIKRKDIIGRAWLRIYPFSKFGLITHDLGADNLDTYSGLSVDEPSGTLSTASD